MTVDASPGVVDGTTDVPGDENMAVIAGTDAHQCATTTTTTTTTRASESVNTHTDLQVSVNRGMVVGETPHVAAGITAGVTVSMSG